MSIRRVVRGTGITFLVAGVLVLLFVAYELWGTGFTTASHQRALRSQFDHELKVHRATPTTTTTAPDSPTTTTAPLKGVQAPAATAPVGDGQPVAILQIPKINIDFVVVQGTDTSDLIKGPGHYTGTPMPGNPGNAAIAGHRTTYLHPFYNLDALAPGDPIYVTTLQGRFQYDVTRTQVVQPDDLTVLDATSTPTLTLTTCNPRYSASTRLVVQADLVSPVVQPAPVAKASTHEGHGRQSLAGDQLAGEAGSWGGALWWGLACAALAAAALLLHRRLRHWGVYVVGTLGMLVLLFFFFGAVNPLLPAGF